MNDFENNDCRNGSDGWDELMHLTWMRVLEQLPPLKSYSRFNQVATMSSPSFDEGYVNELIGIEIVRIMILRKETGRVKARLDDLRRNSSFRDVDGMCTECQGDLDTELKDYESAAESYRRAYAILFNEGRDSDATLCSGKLLCAYSNSEDYENAAAIRNNLVRRVADLRTKHRLTYEILSRSIPKGYV